MGRIANFFDGNFQSLNDAGDPNSGGYYKFYTAGVTSPTSADLKDTYPTRAAAIAQTPVNALNADNGVEMGSDGRPTTGIWLNGDYKVYCFDEDDVQLWVLDYINADPLPGASAIPDSLIKNGSFENWTGDEPDSITCVKADGATYVESTTSYHGESALKVVGAAAGGVTSTWDDYFEVSAGLELLVEFFIQCALASTNIVRILWYTDDAGTPAGTPSTDIYNATAAVASYARKYGFATPPAGAKFGKLRSILSDAGGLADTVYLDGIRVTPAVTNVNDLTTEDDITLGGALSDKGFNFNPSGASSTVIPGARIVGVISGTTGGTTVAFKYGIIGTVTYPGVAGRQMVGLTRTLATKHQLIVSSEAGASFVGGVYSSAGPEIEILHAVDGGTANAKYTMQIWEFD